MPGSVFRYMPRANANGVWNTFEASMRILDTSGPDTVVARLEVQYATDQRNTDLNVDCSIDEYES